MMNPAMDVDSTPGILSEIDTILTYIEHQVDDTLAGTIIPGSVLENIKWDHPPNFPRRTPDDPLVKELLAHTITEKQDPYISRIAREAGSNLPHV
jgi:hypothetical protein